MIHTYSIKIYTWNIPVFICVCVPVHARRRMYMVMCGKFNHVRSIFIYGLGHVYETLDYNKNSNNF